MPRVKNIFKTIQKRSDRQGNFFIVEEEPRYGNWKVYVHIHTEAYRRLIGEIDRDNRIMFVKRDKSRHLHSQMRAYGFNYTALNDLVGLQNVLMLEEDGEHQTYYLIPVDFLLKNGTVKNFKDSGFEIQVFLRVEYLERFATKTHFTKGRLTP